MRASRLVELLVLLQLRGGAPARELAEALEVSVRTIHRDVEALSAAGVPVYAEPGRHGGIRLQAGYRIAGLPSIDPGDARSLLLAAVPAIARELGLDPAAADRTVLPALDAGAEAAARSVRDRLLVEPGDWFQRRDDAPWLLEVAAGVWEARETRLTYRGADQVVRPLGLVLKGGTWYLLARTRDGEDRLFRMSRISEATVLEHRFDRPDGFDLAAAWRERIRAFLDSIPVYPVSVRVAPGAEPLLGLLQEGTPPLPLADDIERDADGWAHLRLRFERPESAARLLLQLGAEVEVLDPPELRGLVARAAGDLHALYQP